MEPDNEPTTDDAIHATVLLDHSGSMGSVRETVVNGMNAFIDDQRATADDGARLLFTLVQFDTKQPFDVVIDAVPVLEVRKLTLEDYRPDGGTPLLDAVGRLIETLDRRVAGRPDEDQIVFIITDGLENASTDFDIDAIRRRIDARTEDGWTFLYLGAEHDSFSTAGRMGVASGNTRNFVRSDDGTSQAFSEVNSSVQVQRLRSRDERDQRRNALFDERTDRHEVIGRDRKPATRHYFRPRPGESSQQMARRIREVLDPDQRQDRS